jgi:hypothetical protein
MHKPSHPEKSPFEKPMEKMTAMSKMMDTKPTDMKPTDKPMDMKPMDIPKMMDKPMDMKPMDMKPTDKPFAEVPFMPPMMPSMSPMSPMMPMMPPLKSFDKPFMEAPMQPQPMAVPHPLLGASAPSEVGPQSPDEGTGAAGGATVEERIARLEAVVLQLGHFFGIDLRPAPPAGSTGTGTGATGTGSGGTGGGASGASKRVGAKTSKRSRASKKGA